MANEGWSSLEYAARFGEDLPGAIPGHEDELYGCDKESTGWTPLHFAAWRGDTEAVRILIDHGANITARTCEGWTPMTMAEAGNHTQTVEALQEASSLLHSQRLMRAHLKTRKPGHTI